MALFSHLIYFILLIEVIIFVKCLIFLFNLFYCCKFLPKTSPQIVIEIQKNALSLYFYYFLLFLLMMHNV